MPDFQLPSVPTASAFGYPLALRQDEFHRLAQTPNLPTHRIEFKGDLQNLPILRVPINLPKYRLSNGRTASAQEEYLAKHPAKSRDFFEADPELLEVQEVQHSLLLPLAKQANLFDYFKDAANKQIEPILLDEKGFVVNGNRRLAAWRHLLGDDPKKFAHFAYVDVVVLPYCEEKEIDRLEAALQIKTDIKANYSWDTEANMMLHKRKLHGFTDRELADIYGMKENDVRELLDMRDYAAEYLRSRNKENHWSLMSGGEFAFRKLVNARSKLGTAGEKELFKQAAFILIDDADAVGERLGRLYEAIPGVQEHLEVIKDKLQNRFQVQPAGDDADLGNLFGAASPKEDAIDLPLAAEIRKPENVDAAREIIVEAIESQKELKKDAKSANYLLTTISKANGLMAAAVAQGLRPEANRSGVAEQLAELDASIVHIRKWLAENA